MKRILFSAAIILVFLANGVSADAYPVDTLIAPATGYSNPYGGLGNANPASEEKWLEGVLGKTYNDPTIFFISKNESYFAGKDLTSLDGWDPGFSWVYAVVKYDGLHAAFADEGDNLLTIPGTQGPYTGVFRYGISHVTFFGDSTTVLIPEPVTMLLLGLGLLGLGIAVRRRL